MSKQVQEDLKSLDEYLHCVTERLAHCLPNKEKLQRKLFKDYCWFISDYFNKDIGAVKCVKDILSKEGEI